MSETEKNKEILYYKLKDDKYFYAVQAVSLEKGTILSGFKDNLKKLPVDYTNTINNLKNLNVFDIWYEPVYQEISKTVYVEYEKGKNSLQVIVTSKDIFLPIENKYIDVLSLRELLYSIKNKGIKYATHIEKDNNYSLPRWNMKVTTIDIGCIKNINVSNLDDVLDAFDKLFEQNK